MFFTTKAGHFENLCVFIWSNATVVTNGYCVYLFIVRYQQLYCNMRIKNQIHFSLLMKSLMEKEEELKHFFTNQVTAQTWSCIVQTYKFYLVKLCFPVKTERS